MRVNKPNDLLDDYLRYMRDTFVTASKDEREHILKFRHEAISECACNHIFRTPRLCLFDIQRLSAPRYPHGFLVKDSPTEAEGIAIPFLRFDWERISSSWPGRGG